MGDISFSLKNISSLQIILDTIIYKVAGMKNRTESKINGIVFEAILRRNLTPGLTVHQG